VNWAVAGILTSLAGAAVWQVVLVVWTRWRFRQGALHGHWFELTFTPAEPKRVHSVELVILGHHDREVRGTMWRLRESDLGERWQLTGTYEDGLVNAVYRCTAGNGNDGGLMLWRISRNRYQGRCFEYAPDLLDDVVWQSEVCWVRLGTNLQREAIEHLPDGAFAPYVRRLPRSARRRLEEALRGAASHGRIETDAE
jgi:hypothetical protein